MRQHFEPKLWRMGTINDRKTIWKRCSSRKFRRVNLGQTLLLACITGISCSVERRQATKLIIKASFFAEFSPIFWERTLGTKVIRTFIRPDLSLSNFLLLCCDRTVLRAFFLELLCDFTESTESTVILGGPVRSQSCWGKRCDGFFDPTCSWAS